MCQSIDPCVCCACICVCDIKSDCQKPCHQFQTCSKLCALLQKTHAKARQGRFVISLSKH